MEQRAINSLCNLPDQDFFVTLSKGLRYVVEQAEAASREAHLLHGVDGKRGVRILKSISEEEAAKYQILIDAVRCPRSHKNFGRALRRFNDHLAKGIYVRYYNTYPAKFKESQEYVDNLRQSYYLDGFEGIEYIFNNEILRHREETLYVDFVKYDANNADWVSPKEHEDLWKGLGAYPEPTEREIFKLNSAMHRAGFGTPGALKLIAEKWRRIEMTPDLSWIELMGLNRETWVEMRDKGLLADHSQELLETIVRLWLFPLYSIRLEPDPREEAKKVLEELQEAQGNLYPY